MINSSKNMRPYLAYVASFWMLGAFRKPFLDTISLGYSMEKRQNAFNITFRLHYTREIINAE